MNTNFTGKRIIVTGGGSGVGEATALALAGAGARLLICGRREDRLDAAAARIHDKTGHTVEAVAADVGDLASVTALFQEADRRLGGLDILVSGASVGANSILNTDPAEFAGVVAANLLSYAYAARLAADRMGPGGQIIHIGSLCTRVLDNGASLYVATKTGVEGLTHSLRKELLPRGIRVGLVQPGAIASGMVTETPEEQERLIDAGEMLRPAAVAEAILWLLSQPEGVAVPEIDLRPATQAKY